MSRVRKPRLSPIIGAAKRAGSGIDKIRTGLNLEHGLPELRYQDKPNRTDQAYKAALPPQMD